MVDVEVEYDYTAENDDELTVRVGDIITNVTQDDGGWWEGELKGRRGLFPDNFVKVRSKDVKMAAIKNASTEENPRNNGGGGVTYRKEKKRRCRVLFSYKPVNEDELELEVDELIEILEEVEEGWWRGRVQTGDSGVFPSNFVQEIEAVEVDVVDGPIASDKTLQSRSLTAQQAYSEIKPKPIKGVGYGNIFQDGMVKLKATTGAGQEPKVNPTRSSAYKKPSAPSVASSAAPPQPLNAPQLPPKPVKEQARVLYFYDAQSDDELTLKEGDVINIVSKEVEDKGWWKGEMNGRIGVFPDNFVELIVTDETRTKKPDRPEKGPTLATAKMDSELAANGPASVTTDSPTVNRNERVTSLPRGLSAKRLPPEVPRKDGSPTEEKNEKPQPPLPCKKPQLRPSQKRFSGVVGGGPTISSDKPPKTSTFSSTTTSSPFSVAALKKTSVASSSSSSSCTERTNGGQSDDSRSSTHPSNIGDDGVGGSGVAFDGIESSSEKLVHLTANRAKNPNRRPPSHLFHKESDKTNGDVAHLKNGDNPWMREMKRAQATKRASQVIHDPHAVRDVVIAETETDKSSGSLGRTAADKDVGRLPASAKMASSSLSSSSSSSSSLSSSTTTVGGGIAKLGGSTTSPTVPSKTVEVDAKDSESLKTNSLSDNAATAIGQLSLSPDVKVIVNLLQDGFNSRFDQLSRQYSELSAEQELQKIVLMKRVQELYGELQIEKKHRLALQDEIQRLREVRK